MRVNEARSLALVEHGARDVARKAAFASRAGKIGDASIDACAHVGGERVEAFLQELPLGADELRHVCEAATAKVAATLARPPRIFTRGHARAALDVVVNGEQSFSHDGGFVARLRQLEIEWPAHALCTRMRP